jgi:hypothetical protein
MAYLNPVERQAKSAEGGNPEAPLRACESFDFSD